MATKIVRVVVEFSEPLKKLSGKQIQQLKKAFHTELVNVVTAPGVASMAALDFENITKAPKGKKNPKPSAAKAGGKKSNK